MGSSTQPIAIYPSRYATCQIYPISHLHKNGHSAAQRRTKNGPGARLRTILHPVHPILFNAVHFTQCRPAARPLPPTHERRYFTLRAKNYVAAIGEFEEAYKVKPKASPLVNIALCHKAMFAYPKAIAALETALSKHSDTMDENDKKAANSEIEEMRALLSYVTFQVTPGQFSVQIDGEAYPAASRGDAVPLSPGPHVVRVSADGYAAVEEKLTLASGKRTLAYTLRANMGYIHIKAASAKYAIAIDQKAIEYGEWSGLLPPGPHIIDMYVPGSPTAPYRVRVDVEVGKSYEISPGKGGVPLTGNALTPPIPPNPPLPKPPAPVYKGPFFLAAFSLFTPTEHPQIFGNGKYSPGVQVGGRVGYRVNTPVSFDVMGEYSNMLVGKTVDPEIKYNLEQVHAGLNMRLQTPGRIARFYGNFGGGAVFSSLEFLYPSKVDNQKCASPSQLGCYDSEGVDGYFLLEMGLQFTFGGVLVDLTVGNYLQSTRNFKPDTYRDWLPSFHGGLRVGYGWW
ncbi:MAG: hypothetical protein IPK82_06225 [Polyangiaceae bacterium]|nr:hypothetical protein [Polyangiaceae bacterium]